MQLSPEDSSVSANPKPDPQPPIDAVEGYLSFSAHQRALSPFPAVQNGLLSAAHAAYCMAWKDCVNPDSQPYASFVSGIGAEFATVLYSTDSDRVEATEAGCIEIEDLRAALRAFDGIDSDPFCVKSADELAARFAQRLNGTFSAGIAPGEDGGRLLRFIERLPDHSKIRLAGDLAVQFRCMLEQRLVLGYWATTIHDLWGLAVGMAIELKRLGVSAAEVQAVQEGDLLTIAFPWRYPFGGIVRTREFRIHTRTNTGNFLADRHHELPQLDCYYEKANDRSALVWPYHRLRARFNHDAVMLLGAPVSRDDRRQEHLQQIFRLRSGGALELQELRIAEHYEQAMAEQGRHAPAGLKHPFEYGWKLAGYRVKCLPRPAAGLDL